nr:MAG TPA: foot protein [Caudoviricetes sp.]
MFWKSNRITNRPLWDINISNMKKIILAALVVATYVLEK